MRKHARKTRRNLAARLLGYLPQPAVLALAGVRPFAGGEGDGDPPKDKGGDDAKFTQADVDRMIGRRLAEERDKLPSDDELQQLRDRAAKADELENAQKSEKERLEAERDAEKEKREAAEQAAQQSKDDAAETKRRAAVVAAASNAGAAVPGDVPKLLDLSKLTVTDAGEVEGAAEAVEEFLEANPVYKGGEGRPRGGGDGGPRGGSGSEDDLFTKEQIDAMSPEEVNANWDKVQKSLVPK